MFKKGLKLLLIAVMMVSVTGCYKYNTGVTIKSDKTVDFKMTIAIDKKAMESLSSSMGESSKTDPDSLRDSLKIDESEYKDNGYKVENYENITGDHEWYGYTITKNLGSIDDLLLDSDKAVNMYSETNNADFDNLKLFYKDGDTYKAKLVYDFSSSSEMDMSSYKDMFDFSFELNVPDKTISNNATEVSKDGSNLTWNLEYGKKSTVEFSFKLDKAALDKAAKKENNSNTTIYIIIGVATVLVLGFLYLLFGKKTKAE